MKIEIEVISTNIIHPSSPTPKDVSNYKLSFMDQMLPPVFFSLTFFYKATDNYSLTKSEISMNLKKSLSKTLSLYYPFTGRIVDNSYVHEQGGGITYVEAEANCKLSDVINKPNAHDLDKLFLPVNIYDVAEEVLLVTQATFFNCGGVAIGVAMSHRICDAWSISLFVNCWAAISREDDAYIRSPILDGATLFPPRDLGGYDSRSEMMKMIVRKDLVNKRFLFTSSKIDELRDIYSNTTRATRIETLSAFIWTRLMVSTKINTDNLKRKTIMALTVNIRKRAIIPPLSDDLFGNVVQPAILLLDGEEEQEDTCSKYRLVEKMREAIRSIDGDYVHKLWKECQCLNISKNDTDKKPIMSKAIELERFLFTSLCRFPLYEDDFGWGKPVWISISRSPKKNCVAFIDSVSEGGIEAWVNLTPEDMAKFEVDQEILAYTTI